MLKEVKQALKITGKYDDTSIKQHINEVKRFMKDGGVAESVIKDPENIGVISRGVADLLTLGSGVASFSKHFIDSVVQLALKAEAENEELPSNL